MDIRRALEVSLSQNPSERQAALSYLEDITKTDFLSLVEGLIITLGDTSLSTYLRSTACLFFKNILVSRVPSIRIQFVNRWLSLDPEFRIKIKKFVLSALGTENTKPSVLAQVIAALAFSEFPNQGWPELVPFLSKNIINMNASSDVREASLECLGYICQDLPQNVLAQYSSELLNIIVRCMDVKESNRVRLVATKALFNSLEFASRNFVIEEQRNLIMQHVCECSVAPDPNIQIAGLQCLCRLISLYYPYMETYMTQALFKITFEAMKSPNENVALHGIEFWSSLSEEEERVNICAKEGNSHLFSSKGYAIKALPYIIPVLLERLVEVTEEMDEDEWNPHKAAGVCLMLMTSACGNEIVSHVLPFVSSNCKNNDWRFRDASLLAFGSILDIPSSDFLQNIAKEGLLIILDLSKDTSINVRDTSMWALGRVYEKVPNIALNKDFTIRALSFAFESLKDRPRVSANAAWAFNYMISAIYTTSVDLSGQRPLTHILSQQYERLIEASKATFMRNDANENHLRSAAFEMLLKLIECHPSDAHFIILRSFTQFLQNFLNVFMTKNIEKGSSLFTQLTEIQSMHCNLLQAYLRELEINEVSSTVTPLMNNLISILKSTQISVVQEDVLLTLGSLFPHVSSHELVDHTRNFMPYVISSLSNIQESSICISAASVVSELTSFIGPGILGYSKELISVVFQNLQNQALEDSVKPSLIGLIGDMALAIGPYFKQHLTMALEILRSLGGRKISQDDDIDLIEIVDAINSSTLEAYTGIIQGLYQNASITQEDLALWGPYFLNILSLITMITEDANRSDDALRSACGLIGDLLHTFKGYVKEPLSIPSIRGLVSEAKASPASKTKTIGAWVDKLFENV